MKILQIAPYYTPTYGGQERYIYNLSKCLIKSGHEVTVLTSDFPRCQTDCHTGSITDTIKVIRHRCIARILGNPITPGMLLDKDLMRQYDIIHVHNEHSFPAMVAYLYKNRVTRPMLLTCHGQLKFGSRIKDSFERLYSESLGKSIFHKADHIVVLSESDRIYVSSLGINLEKCSVIPNAIDPRYYEDLTGQASTLTDDYPWLKLPENKRIVLFVGPVIKRKGVEYLLKAIPSVIRTAGTDLLFVLVGDGEYLSDAKRLSRALGIDSYVLFTGQVSEASLARFYLNANLFVLPSLSEGLPTSILEAMYYKLPVVSTNIPGIKDHFNEHALLVEPEDEVSLAKAIALLLNDVGVNPGVLGDRKENIIKNYVWEKVARDYERICMSMVK